MFFTVPKSAELEVIIEKQIEEMSKNIDQENLALKKKKTRRMKKQKTKRQNKGFTPLDSLAAQ